jgi:YVTN family beta-propeller protein
MLASLAVVVIITSTIIIMIPYQRIAAEQSSLEPLLGGDRKVSSSGPESYVVDLGPVGVAVNPKTGIVYVSGGLSNTTYIMEKSETYSLGKTIFYVIDGKTNNVIKTIKVGIAPTNVEVDMFRNVVYVTNEDSNTVSVIDGKTNSVIKTITIKNTGLQPESR